MKHHFSILLLIVALLVPVVSYAQNDDQSSPEKRRQWFKEMRAKKHEFMVRELELTQDQREQFFAIYDEMDANLKAINDETRSLEKTLDNRDNISDAEYDAVIDALYNQRYREWNVEKTAKERLSKVLTKKQLVKVKKAEGKFTRALMKQHHQTSKARK